MLQRAATKFELDDPFLPTNKEIKSNNNIEIPQDDQTIEQVLANKEKSEKSLQEEIINLPPQLEDVKKRREEHIIAYKVLHPLLKGSNIEPVHVDCHLSEEEMYKIALTELEKVRIKHLNF